jgi:Leucine-rich repeat (LRR) protein
MYAQVFGTLALSGLGLRQLPSTYSGMSIWGYLTSMTALDVSNNMLQTLVLLPVPELLVKLDLSNNHVLDLDEALSALCELRHANLNNNKLTLLPPCIKYWSKVSGLPQTRDLTCLFLNHTLHHVCRMPSTLDHL